MRVDALTARVWRHGIGLVIAFDAVQLAVRTHMRAPLASSSLPVPALFRAIALSAPALVALAIVGVVCASLFARGRAPIVCAVLALAANRLLLDAFGAVDGIFDETSYHAAAALLGWICGHAFARAIGERDSREVEALSALGAVAMFAGTYLNAGTSKWLAHGTSWADGDTIRLMVLAHREAGHRSWLDPLRDLIARDARAVQALSASTIVIQCGAFIFPWTRRTRLVWGALFVAFHVGIHLVAASIFFIQAVLLGVLFATPWPRLLSRDPATDEPEGAIAHERRVAAVGAIVVLALISLVVVPIRPRAHPVERIARAAPPLGVTPVASSSGPRTCAKLGPLVSGMELDGGWRLRAIVLEPERVTLDLSRAEQSVLIDVSDRADGPKGRFSIDELQIAYRQTALDPELFDAAGHGIAKLLRAAARDTALPVAFRAWVAEAR